MVSATWREPLETASKLAGIAIEQQHLHQELVYKAYHDPLTGAGNAALLEERLHQALTFADRTGRVVALLCIDLDRFKTVNDFLGHRTGDLLLCQIARRLRSCVRHTDTLARTGGDEFTLILPDLDGPPGAATVAGKLLEVLNEAFLVDGREVFVTASIGVSLYPLDARTPALMEQHADTAMYRAKSEGKNGFRIYQEQMGAPARQRLELESHLRHALEAGQFYLNYQPQLDPACARVAGVEALLRWKHPAFGMISPAAFIPVAEDTGMIVPIGEWVLQEACRQHRRWYEEGSGAVRIAVNVSAVQFARDDFTATVERALRSSGMQPGMLELELTETAVLSDLAQAARRMLELREMGVTIAIDDFGTGQSSLSYLHKLPIQVLKLDQSFLSDTAGGAPLVENIIRLAHSLGKIIIAEGVETEEQISELISLSCDLVQGYYFAKPMGPDELGLWLRRGNAARESAAAPLIAPVKEARYQNGNSCFISSREGCRPYSQTSYACA